MPKYPAIFPVSREFPSESGSVVSVPTATNTKRDAGFHPVSLFYSPFYPSF